MKRTVYSKLLAWKNNHRRKPLLLQGARQVGKTYLVEAFGKSEYGTFVKFNFEQNPTLGELFKKNLRPADIIENLSLYSGKKISSQDTLIFFDEIQIVPEVLTSLKYFQEEAPEYHIIAAGSLPGVSVAKESSFPVGKVNFMMLYPMSFLEYLVAFGEELLAEKLQEKQDAEPFLEVIHERLLSHFKRYLYLGGMPEVLQEYKTNGDIALVREIQNEILEAYSRDFSKYSDKNLAIKITEFWQSIPRQLAKENKKFKYSDARKKSRASTFEQAIIWLKKAGLINVAYNISAPKLPLSGYADSAKFKVYHLDCGLLGAMLNISSDIIITGDQLFAEYNGAFIENFVASELVTTGVKELYYWTSKSDAEVDFILQNNNNNTILPLEVKSGLNRNIKSLRSYADKYQPQKIYRTSPRNFTEDNDFINIPLYGSFLLAGRGVSLNV